MKRYKIVYADPPWGYDDKARSGERGAQYKYSTMSSEEIRQLPLERVIDDDCVLFLWVTFPFLEEGFKVMRAWGFEYKTVGFVWIKKNKKDTESNFWGMGNWSRSNAEICLMGVRGNPKRESAGVHSVIESPVREHSKKPDEVRDRIVELCGDVLRVELFARDKVDGWDCWGIEVDGEKIEEKGAITENRNRGEGFEIVSSEPLWDKMDVGEIKEKHRKAKERSKDQHNVFVWVGDKHLYKAEKMMLDLGYKLFRRMVWDKERGGGEFPAKVMSHEYVLWFYGGGKPVLPEGGKWVPQGTVVRDGNIVGDRKSEKIYRMLERMFPNLQRAILYNKVERSGWTSL